MERVAWVMDELRELKKDVDSKHHENEQRFDRVENKLSEITGMLRLATALLVANASLVLVHYIR